MKSSMMLVVNASQAMVAVRTLVDEYRATCLWSLKEDYVPNTREEALRVLDLIQQHGDLAAFKRAGALKKWL